MSRAAKEKRPIPKPPPASAQMQAQAEQLAAFRAQQFYEQCKYRALGRVLFSDIPVVRGTLIANMMVDALTAQFLVAQSKIIIPGRD